VKFKKETITAISVTRDAEARRSTSLRIAQARLVRSYLKNKIQDWG
jgi:hypothetical protein